MKKDGELLILDGLERQYKRRCFNQYPGIPYALCVNNYAYLYSIVLWDNFIFAVEIYNSSIITEQTYAGLMLGLYFTNLFLLCVA